MAEILSAGVFIEEVPSAVQVIQPVSTSNMGIAGASQRGPDEEATLVTSFEQYTRIFGDLIAESRLGLSMAAFFQNGGRRAYVVRVMPSDAVEADGDVTSARRNFQTNIGDGATATVTQAVLTPTALVTDIYASGSPGVTIRWRSDDSSVSAEALFQRDGVTALVQDSVGHPSHHYEGRVITSIPSDGVDSSLPSIMPGATITLNWDPDGSTPTTLTLTQVGTTLRATGTSVAGTVAELDLVTGFLVITFAGAEVPVLAGDGTAITLDFTPGTTVRSVTDDGIAVADVGIILDTGPELTAPGSITYAGANAGDYTFTAAAGFEPGNGCPVLMDYDILAWNLDPVSVGTWADDMRFEVFGNDDFYDDATATYSRFDAYVRLLNSATGLFDIQETFEELTFTDATSPQYFPDVVNDLSDLVNVVEPALNGEAPSHLNGLDRSLVVAAGDELTGNRQIATTLLDAPIVPRSFSLTYVDDTGTTRTITDDGAGNLIGDVDGAGTNTLDYTTGALDVTVSDEIGQDQLVTADYRSTAEEANHTDVFTGGSDGTFTSAVTYGRSQFTVITLQPTYQGIYALDRIEELMQVVLPDFAGDITITKDLMDYADSREVLPAGGDRFVILMVPQGSTAQEAVDFLRVDIAQNSKFAAMYWPWVRIADPLADNRPIVFPPLGHLAGIYARTDATRNVGKAPAGTIEGALRFLLGLETNPTQGERDVVYPARINPLQSSPQTGLAVWGARTTSLQSEWRYINARRLFMFVEKSVFNATHWIVFENNGEALWARIRSQLEGFLNGLFNDGLFAGATPAQSFFVRVDSSNNDQTTIDAGQVIIDIGIAPNRPAEFVRFRFQQKTLTS